MSKVKALIVSNDPAMRRFLQQNLSDMDYELATTTDTSDGLKSVLEAESPDLVILDIMMPSLDGIEVCLRIRQWSLVPIILLSSWGVGEGKIRSLNLGAEGYLTEPFGIEELKARIDEIIERNLIAAEIDSSS